jgi:hypothetical protein
MSNPAPYGQRTQSFIDTVRSRPAPALALGALVLVLLGACVFFGIAQAAGPASTLNSFCSDLRQRKYDDAYGLLSSSAQAHIARSQFVADAQAQDQIDGAVRSCSSPQGKSASLSLNPFRTATAYKVQVARDSAFSGALALTHQWGGWRIDRIDPSAVGTDLAPLHVADSFCASLATQDYSSAYADLSARQHADISQADWAKSYTQQLSAAGAKLTGCTQNLKGYTVKDATALVDMNAQVQITLGSASSTVPVPLHLTLLQEAGSWKIDLIQSAPGLTA